MPQISDLRSFLIEWNNNFPLDRDYRVQNKILFNSSEHRSICQIDVYLSWLENEIFREHEETMIEIYKKKELYDKGEWISEKVGLEENEEKLFDDIDVSKISF